MYKTYFLPISISSVWFLLKFQKSIKFKHIILQCKYVLHINLNVHLCLPETVYKILIDIDKQTLIFVHIFWTYITEDVENIQKKLDFIAFYNVSNIKMSHSILYLQVRPTEKCGILLFTKILKLISFLLHLLHINNVTVSGTSTMYCMSDFLDLFL